MSLSSSAVRIAATARLSGIRKVSHVMSNVPMSVLIQQEIDRRKARSEQQEDMSMSAQIQREIDRRKAERARVKASMRLVAPDEQRETGNEA